MCEFYSLELLQRKPLEEISIISNLNYSLLEKSSVKLLPILNALKYKMAYEDTIDGSRSSKKIVVEDRKDEAVEGEELGLGKENCDMKNILGYLNQSEWIYSLNIGNIMQISPLTLQDFMSHSSLELELTREFVLEKVC